MQGLRPSNPTEKLSIKEYATLGRYRHLGLLLYRDLDAYFCTNCELVINVKCPSCGIHSENRTHLSLGYESAVFNVERPLSTSKADGFYWTAVECKKCDFKFRIIIR